jgi:hypothetical protein
MEDVETIRNRIRKLRAARRGTQPPVHGRSGYDNWGCRCQVCRDAKRRANAAYYPKRKYLNVLDELSRRAER